MMTDKVNQKLSQLHFLPGHWKGQGEGFGRRPEVEHSYQAALNGQFIQSKTRSVTRNEAGEVLEVHEDLGMFSYDSARERVVLRGFYSEGYINVYLLEEDDDGEKGLIFTTEKTENAGGLRARLRMDVISATEYTLTLDLAKADEEFKACQVTKMRKVSEAG